MSDVHNKAEDAAIVRLNLSSIASAFVGAMLLVVMTWTGNQLLDQAQKMAVVIERQNELFRRQDDFQARIIALEKRGINDGQR